MSEHDTTNETTIDLMAPESPASTQTKRPRASSEINSEHGTVTISGHVYHVKDLTELAKAHLVLVGLRYVLVTADDPVKRLVEINAGRFAVRGPKKEKEPPKPKQPTKLQRAIAILLIPSLTKAAKEAGDPRPDRAVIAAKAAEQVAAALAEELAAEAKTKDVRIKMIELSETR